MGKADVFLILCLIFIFGVFIASLFINFNFQIRIALIFSGFIAGLFLMGLFFTKPNCVLAGAGLIFFSIAVCLFQYKYFSVLNNILVSNDGESVILVGQVIREPQLGYKNQRLVFSVEKIIFDSGKEVVNNQKELGKVLIYTNNYDEYKYLDRLQVQGIIKIPKNLGQFDYQGYLAKEGIAATLNYPQIAFLSSSEKVNFVQNLYSKILFFKKLMRVQMEKNLEPRAGAVNQAMILGDSQMMPDELKQKLSQSGLSHAIAISGAHIVLFSLIVFEALLFFGFWKKQAASITLFLIVFYVILVGGMASAVRSGIMAGLLMLAELFDRVGENERLLAIAGFFILLQNPLALKYDLGFQLSFLAMMGLFWFAPLIKNWLLKKSNGKWQEFIEVLSATIAAQIFTFPILIFNFGYVSIVSLLSNLLITPLMPFLMAFGLIFPIIGLIFSKLGWLLSFFDGVLTKGLLLIVDWSASVPFAILSFQINAWLVGLMYLIIFIFVFWLRKHFHNFEFLL